MAYPAGPRGTRLHGPGWWTRAGRPSQAGPGRPGTRRSLPGWLGAVRPGRPGEGEAAPARPGARPRGGAVGGPSTGAGIGRDKGSLEREEDGVSMSRHSFQEDLVLVSGMGQTPHWASSTGGPCWGLYPYESHGRPCFSSLDLSPFCHPFHPRS